MSEDEMFEAVSHPLRIKILQKLAEESMGFSELKRKLGIKSSGKLDFHLKKLGNLITTNEEGKYALTKEGYAALQAINTIKRYGWQRRAYILNLLVAFAFNLYFLILDFQRWLWIVLPASTAWIAFHTYWSVFKRKIFKE